MVKEHAIDVVRQMLESQGLSSIKAVLEKHPNIHTKITMSSTKNGNMLILDRPISKASVKRMGIILSKHGYKLFQIQPPKDVPAFHKQLIAEPKEGEKKQPPEHTYIKTVSDLAAANSKRMYKVTSK